MFDSVLRRETLPGRRFGSGAVIAAVVFAGAGALGFRALSRARSEAGRREVAVTFVRAPPPALPAPAPVAAQERPRPRKVEQPGTVLPQAIVAPTVVPQERPPEQEPPPQPAGPAGGEPGGDVGGLVGGIQGGVGVEAPQAGPVEFDPGKMDPPRLLGGPNPQYTEKALEREVQGTMVVKCVISAEGKVAACRVIRGLPFMDRAVIDALERRRYSPATLGGKPVEVDYTFRLTLRLPE
jgi:protein TonB